MTESEGSETDPGTESTVLKSIHANSPVLIAAIFWSFDFIHHIQSLTLWSVEMA